MISQGTIKCPMCNEEVDILMYWKRVETKFFHLCKKCLTRQKDSDKFLKIGFIHGYRRAIEDIEIKISDLKKE